MDSEQIVKLKEVWVAYEDLVVLEGVNLSVYQDDFLGIMGPNGGGKTTLLKLILGLVPAWKGEAAIFGTSPQKARRFVGYVPQHSRFDFDFPVSVEEVVLMGRYRHSGLFKKYDAEDRKITQNALKTVGMWELGRRQIGKLSRGQQQRVLLARALVSEPRLLILDEPTSSVDARMQTGFYELLGELKHKMAIILVSHDVGAVSVHVDKIACLNRKLFYHNSREVTAEELMETYQCPVEMIAHGMPHRVLKEHEDEH
jgi:zinc transport system ATP-binding protein